MVATGLIIERKSPVVAMVFLSDRGQKIVAPYRGKIKIIINVNILFKIQNPYNF